MDKKRVIVAARDLLVQSGLESILEKSGSFRVIGRTASGSELVELATTLKPDLVATDVDLEEMSAIAATQVLKESLQGLAILIITETPTETMARAAFAAGAYGVCSTRGLTAQKMVLALEALSLGAAWLDSPIAEAVLRQVGADAPQDLVNRIAFTEREQEIIGMVAAGENYETIAQALSLSVETIRKHMRSIGRKTGVQRRTEVAVLALREGLAAAGARN